MARQFGDRRHLAVHRRGPWRGLDHKRDPRRHRRNPPPVPWRAGRHRGGRSSAGANSRTSFPYAGGLDHSRLGSRAIVAVTGGAVPGSSATVLWQPDGREGPATIDERGTAFGQVQIPLELTEGAASIEVCVLDVMLTHVRPRWASRITPANSGHGSSRGAARSDLPDERGGLVLLGGSGRPGGGGRGTMGGNCRSARAH